MKIRMAAAICAAFLLAGCTDADWNHTLSYVGLQSEPAPQDAQAAATPDASQTTAPAGAMPAAQSDDWCKQIAKSAADDAAKNGFDAATQQHRAETTFMQCKEFDGAATR